MSEIVERLREVGTHLGDAIAGYRDDNLKRAAMGAVEIARVTRDAADEIETLRAALEPFARNVKAVSLSATLGHITREHLWAARRALEPMP